MPRDEWPIADRQAWQAAIADGGLLTDAGPAARWRQGTRDRVAQSYGRFLGYLEYHGILDRNEIPADRAFRDRVIAYGEQLRQQCASVTVHGYVLNLERALSVMAPDEDWQWLARLAARLKARARPTRNKRRRVVPAEELADLGHRLMDSALDPPEGLRPARRAVRFRDGLMIALLIARVLRLRSFTGLAIGQHLVPVEDGYRIVLAPEDTKNGRPYEAPVPEWLGPYMDIYLTRIRPILLGERRSDRLWISAGGTDMSGSYLYHRLCKVTTRELGRPVNPHLFRDCAMTSRAIDDPDNVRAMQPVLGHSSMRTPEMHYNQAKAIEASRLHQAHIVTKRREITRRAGSRQK
jgi:site-specific recombinase XerD